MFLVHNRAVRFLYGGIMFQNEIEILLINCTAGYKQGDIANCQYEKPPEEPAYHPIIYYKTTHIPYQVNIVLHKSIKIFNIP
jgi:hypothetical protein